VRWEADDVFYTPTVMVWWSQNRPSGRTPNMCLRGWR
jgi:hypothetical protein